MDLEIEGGTTVRPPAEQADRENKNFTDQNQKTTLLIVDDDAVNRIVLKGMLLKNGYGVLVAGNGREAIEMFRKEQPDLILMDIMMPEMDGYEATAIIKQEAGDNFVPIMFLTALTDDAALARCVESGGDDFLSKPYNPIVLNAKIDALLRTRQIYHEKKNEHEALLIREEEIAQDLDIAERILSKISKEEAFDVSNINYYLSPMEQLNGDIIITANKPDGSKIYLLGDFTGHGLGAAIGGLIVFDVFKAMASKGFAMDAIISELNRKLREILPVGRFLAAGIVELYPEYATASIWNGGLPDIYICKNQKGKIRNIKSSHLPLGVLDSNELDTTPEIVRIDHGDQILLYSDGLIEAENGNGEFFGTERLEKFLIENDVPEKLFSRLLIDVEEFTRGCPQRDDLSILEIICDPEKGEGKTKEIKARVLLPPVHWNMSLQFEADAIKNADLIPSLVQMIVDVQGLRPYQQTLYLLVTELYSRALEQGLLGLDPAMKETTNGFEEYYIQREKTLSDLSDASITFDFKHEPYGEGGRLTLCLRYENRALDTGHPSSWTASDAWKGSEYGIKLIESLVDRVEIDGSGRAVSVDYIWGRDEDE